VDVRGGHGRLAKENEAMVHTAAGGKRNRGPVNCRGRFGRWMSQNGGGRGGVDQGRNSEDSRKNRSEACKTMLASMSAGARLVRAKERLANRVCSVKGSKLGRGEGGRSSQESCPLQGDLSSRKCAEKDQSTTVVSGKRESALGGTRVARGVVARNGGKETTGVHRGFQGDRGRHGGKTMESIGEVTV